MGEEAAFDVSRLVFWVMILGIVIAAAGTAIQFGRTRRFMRDALTAMARIEDVQPLSKGELHLYVHDCRHHPLNEVAEPLGRVHSLSAQLALRGGGGHGQNGNCCHQRRGGHQSGGKCAERLGGSAG